MKASKVFIAVILCLGSYGVGTAQEYNDFDLSTYVLPNIVRNELDFSLRSSGQFDNATNVDNDLSAIDGNFTSAFNRFKNTRSFWGTQNAGLDVSGSYKKENGEKNSLYNVKANYSNASRFYRSSNRFLEIGAQTYFYLSGTKMSAETEGDYHQTGARLAIPLKIGKGRIEQVQDARQAIYILNNLAKRGVLTRKLTNEEINTFAHTISTVKNKRFLDSRLRTIDEITTVDSFLVNNKLLATSGPSYFTTLYDYWMYGALFKRGSGTVISGGITPGIQYFRNKRIEDENSLYEYKTKMTVPSINANVAIEYEKPVNVYWQRSASAQLTGGYEYGKLAGMDHNKQNNYQAGIEGKYAWGYYPTSRTNINMGLMEQCYWSKLTWESDGVNHAYSDLSTSTSVFFEMYYYFSPQLRLSVNASLLYQYSGDLEKEPIEDRNINRWAGNLGATLTYSLF